MKSYLTLILKQKNEYIWHENKSLVNCTFEKIICFVPVKINKYLTQNNLDSPDYTNHGKSRQRGLA